MLWVCPVVVVWVVVRVALVVAPLDFKRVRQCSTMCTCSLAVNWVDSLAVVVVDGVFHKSVRCRGCSCWPRCGLSRDLLAPLALALPVRLRRCVLRHSVGAWCVVVGVLPTRGRLVAVVGVDGVGYVRVR